jgi:SpoVK/Ycf46/Vps4 family AAA+-type ATPase
LLSKYIGETEQAMAAMFREAESEGAVLLLDEADSFLQDRRGAQRNFEISEVNEMLQGMERHRGVFICTTNLMDRLDPAAMRRFTFKIEFLPLTPTQREAVFMAEACSGQGALPASIARRLADLDQLCLGDVAAVKRQADILDTPMAPEEFLEQLEAEHRLKPEVRERRSMGFVR